MRFKAAEVVDNSRKSAPHFGQVRLLSGAWVWHSEQVCTVTLLKHFFNFTTKKDRGLPMDEGAVLKVLINNCPPAHMLLQLRRNSICAGGNHMNSTFQTAPFLISIFSSYQKISYGHMTD
jgi:hypothetical protein